MFRGTPLRGTNADFGLGRTLYLRTFFPMNEILSAHFRFHVPALPTSSANNRGVGPEAPDLLARLKPFALLLSCSPDAHTRNRSLFQDQASETTTGDDAAVLKNSESPPKKNTADAGTISSIRPARDGPVTVMKSADRRRRPASTMSDDLLIHRMRRSWLYVQGINTDLVYLRNRRPVR